MQKALVVAQFEYLAQVRRWGFIVVTLLLPLAMIVVMLLMVAFAALASLPLLRDEPFGYIDQAGILTELPEQARSTDALRGEIAVLRFGDEAAASQALQKGTIGAFFIIPPDFVESGQLRGYGETTVPPFATARMERLINAELLKQLGPLDERVRRPVQSVEQLQLSGAPLADPLENVGNLLGPGLMIVTFLSLLFNASGYLLQGFVTEKESRLIEVLAASVRPIDQILGKIIGLGLVGLTQTLIWMGVGGGGLLTLGGSWGIFQHTNPGQLLVILLLMLGGYVLFAATLSGLGAVTAATQEGGQMIGVVMLLSVAPLFVLSRLFDAPNSGLAMGMSFFPYTAPITLALRMGLDSVPAWQVAAGLASVWAAALGMLWVAARMVRFAQLRAGKGLALRELARSFRRT